MTSIYWFNLDRIAEEWCFKFLVPPLMKEEVLSWLSEHGLVDIESNTTIVIDGKLSAFITGITDDIGIIAEMKLKWTRNYSK